MTGCSKLTYSSERMQKAEEICHAGPHIKSVEIPSLSDMLSEECSVYPFLWIFEEVKDAVAFIAHSSGTTGKMSH